MKERHFLKRRIYTIINKETDQQVNNTNKGKCTFVKADLGA